MIDFQGPFKEGLDAYRDVERAKAEIGQVVREFSAQIQGASRGAILEVRIEEHGDPFYQVPKKPEPSHPIWSLPIRPVLVAFGNPTAENPNPIKVLCTFQTSPYGYPVGLKYADVDVRCHDRDSLELALMDLLKHPDTGAKLAQLMESQQTA